MHRWGYAPEIGDLCAHMLNGPVTRAQVLTTIASRGRFHLDNDFVCLAGQEDLLSKSEARVKSHHILNGKAKGVAREFASDLVRLCPIVKCVAISGSLASGGYAADDDIDFDLFVDTGTKYTSYLIATLIGFKYAWRYRKAQQNPLYRTPFLPKIICINVVWPEDQTRPFVRQDAGLAFELLRCHPVYGSNYFRQTLARNPWILSFFPQFEQRVYREELSTKEAAVGRVISLITRHRLARRATEAASRTLVWMLYHLVQWTRRNNPDAVARAAFLRRVKWPYEVLQD